MTVILDDAASFAATALAGFCSVHAASVRAVPGGVLRAGAPRRGKVALVVGGGSGHYPAFAGYVGHGLADGAVAGDVFASPSARHIAGVARAAAAGAGVLLGFGNYAGDVLHFGLAAQKLRAEGIDTRLLAVSDDVASAPAGQHAKRRGIAGDLVVFKIAGAAAEAGESLDEVERLAQHANLRTRSFGVAFSGCTLPGAAAPLFEVRRGTMGVGLGIHGEPGIAEQPLLGASALAGLLVEKLLAEAPAQPGRRVAAILNGLGCSKWEELFVLWTAVEARLLAAGLELVQPAVGEFVTSLDMAGCSLTLTWLDAALEPLWCAPVDAPVLRRGPVPAFADAATPAGTAAQSAPIPALPVAPAASLASQAHGVCLAGLLQRLAAALAVAEEELGRLDAVAGDGDHGRGMARGAAAAAEAAARAAASGQGAGSVLQAAADAWAERAGGTSGALWGAALSAWGASFGDHEVIGPAEVARGARAALEAVTSLGGAQPGDKTLVDALEPFTRTLEEAIGHGQSLVSAWADAAAAATAAAEATAPMTPKLGRARPLAARSIGHCDPGAVSLALAARVIGEALPTG
jgi:dihydroxyacetone kinase